MVKLLNFKGSWRSYQKRILDNLDFHLLDSKLHIIAAPGAGKTTLGIEVISKINKPTLILCPTNTIKNQWKDRICSSFLEEINYNLVSTDIHNPGFLTVITYQALLAAFCGATAGLSKDTDENSEEGDDFHPDDIAGSKRFNKAKSASIIKILKNAKISLLCFDEAHHLRKEWWKALTYLVEELKPKQTLSLTATPPYDADLNEWQRYEELCGSIDEIISIPELVKNNDLCPHQDFIHYSCLRDNEMNLIKKYNADIKLYLDKILNDKELFLYLSKMSFLNPNDSDVEKIFDNPDFYISIASLISAFGMKIPKAFLELFGAKQFELPKFNLNQAKIFLNGFLLTNAVEFKGLENKIEIYLSEAKKYGFIQNKKFVLNDSSKIQKQMANSLGKLDSIVQIVELENSNLGSKLRMVILTDYIKANDTDNSHLGVVPIWRVLKDEFPKISIGVLCGSLIILPKAELDNLYKLLNEKSVLQNCITISTYKEDENFIKITPKESAKHCIVSIVTEMFNRGHVTILVGTQALLGEGWDAPCINSLILSSTVSSYMLSNQMRGRAIRIDKNNPDKISNIWHLASLKVPKITDFTENTIFLKTMSEVDREEDRVSFYDIEQLTKRFEGFEAPSYFNKHEIISGISRVLPNKIFTFANMYGENAFLDLNLDTMEKATNRGQTKQWWNDSLYLGYNRQYMGLATGLNTPKLTAKSLVYTGYKQVFYGILMLFFGTFCYSFALGNSIVWVLYIWFFVLLILLGSLFVKFLRTGSVSSVMKQIAIVHLETMVYLDLIKTSLKNIGLEVNDEEFVFVTCKNLPTEENNLLIRAMQEFLDPIDNPRYILIKKDRLGFFRQIDYFAIPAVLSQNKESVEVFGKLWEKYIGSCEIIYTRNLEGRKILLKARKSAFSSLKREKSQKLSKWQ